MSETRLVPCDSCGRMFTEFEFVETIEEWLCAICASGIDPDDDEEAFHDGQEYGFDE